SVSQPPKPQPTKPQPKPEPKPQPQQPVNSKQWCLPLDFGDWFSKLMGKQQVCITFGGWGGDSGFWPF
ncbi:hypothetical protein IPZ70_29945, partial [Streptomyces polychromogenes]|nr:hypothetical protein [Streptomyces polychromogenes]